MRRLRLRSILERGKLLDISGLSGLIDRVLFRVSGAPKRGTAYSQFVKAMNAEARRLGMTKTM